MKFAVINLPSKMSASSSGSENVEETVLKQISMQFLEMVPLRRMKWQTPSVSAEQLNVEIQKQVLQATVLNPVCKRYPPALSYQRAFMKKLLHMLEDCDVEICDEIYEAYTDLLRQKEEEDDMLCYKTYTLLSGTQLSLQESVNMISFGTTGLSTWQAAQHLAEWAVQNSSALDNRNVVELGSGLGLTGLAICNQCSVKSYTFSDCHSQVLYLLARNIEQNISGISVQLSESSDLNTSCSEASDSVTKDVHILKKIKRQLSLSVESSAVPEEDAGFSELCESPLSPSDLPVDNDVCDKDLQKDLPQLKLPTKYWDVCCDQKLGILKQNRAVHLVKLDWENIEETLFQRLSTDIDVVLAADVVYDKSIIPALVSVLKGLLYAASRPTAYLASTIRNEDTRDQFLITMTAEGLLYEQVDSPTEELFHYDRSVPIEILRIFAAEDSKSN